MQVTIPLDKRVSLSRRRSKRKSPRSEMLKLIMPELGGAQGDALAQAIAQHNVSKVDQILRKVSTNIHKKMITAKRK